MGSLTFRELTVSWGNLGNKQISKNPGHRIKIEKWGRHGVAALDSEVLKSRTQFSFDLNDKESLALGSKQGEE